MKLFGSLRELVATVFRKDTFEITVRPNQTTTYTAARDIQLPEQNSDAVLVSKNSADTLANKTLDSSNIVSGSRLDNAQVRKPGVTSGVATLDFYEDVSGGSNKISVQAPSALTADYSFTLPSSAGSGQSSVLASTAGNGTTTWVRYTDGLTGSSIVQRDASNNFSAGTITATLNGNATNVTGTVAIANGGTGQTTQQAALTALAGTQASGQYLRSNGTNTLLSAIQDADLPASMASKSLTSSAISSAPATVVGTGALKLPTGNATTDRPTGTATQLKGMVRYNDTDDVFEGYNELSGWSSIGGGGTTDRITQASHGFVVGDTLYLSGSTYTKAIATSAAAAEVVGIVSRVIDASTFELTLSGEVSGLSGLTTGEVYFLSAATAGALTITEPSVIGQVSVPVGVASSTTTMYVSPKRGNVIGGTNARAEVSLANGPGSTLVYTPPAGMEAAELKGWVYINGTTKYRFHLSAQFAKNGLDNDWNISYQTTGDTPPAGFAVTIANTGAVSITLPNIGGYSSAKVNYSINGPAVGVTFPLNVESTKVAFTDIQASTAAGVSFKEDGGTVTGSISDAGAWTLGPSSGLTTGHTVRAGTSGSTPLLSLSNTIAADIRISLASASGGGTASFSNDSPVAAGFEWRQGGSAVLGQVSGAGAWTLGPNSPGAATLHKIDGYNASTGGGGALTIYNRATNTTSSIVEFAKGTNDTTTSNRLVVFTINNGLSTSGQINANGANACAFGTFSDERLKENIIGLSPQLNNILALRPVEFDYKSGGHQVGFIAQEMKEVYPDAVGEDESEEKYLTITGWDKTAARLVKAIQELKQQLDDTKAELADLKGRLE
jgi:hypothetical protein